MRSVLWAILRTWPPVSERPREKPGQVAWAAVNRGPGLRACQSRKLRKSAFLATPQLLGYLGLRGATWPPKAPVFQC